MATTAPEDKEDYDSIVFHGIWDKLEDSSIIEELVEEGCSAEIAEKLVSTARQRSREDRRKDAQKRIDRGQIVFAIGAVVTVATFMTAAGGGGGEYIVAWGAILYGLAEIYTGMTGMPKD